MKHQAGPYRIYVLIFLLILITAEVIWSWRKEKGAYQVKETLSNLTIFAGFQFSKYIFAGYQLTILGWFSNISLFTPPRSAWVFALTFITGDFVYYWFHRISHSWKPLWAFHLIHHSAMHMNLTAAYRLNWFSALVSPLFFIPLALLGMPADFIVLSYALNLAYQFFLHTEAVGTLGPIEKVMDTPSSHRVHHGSNAIYIDKNFGGVFIIWDRLFDTYQPETEKVSYGLTTGFMSNNPFVLVTRGFTDLFKPKSKVETAINSTAFMEASPENRKRLPFNPGTFKKLNISTTTMKNILIIIVLLITVIIEAKAQTPVHTPARNVANLHPAATATIKAAVNHPATTRAVAHRAAVRRQAVRH